MKSKLKEYRKLHGLTQSELADKLGIDNTLVSKIENGKRRLSAEMMEKLFGVIGTYTCPICMYMHDGEYTDFMQGICYS